MQVTLNSELRYLVFKCLDPEISDSEDQSFINTPHPTLKIFEGRKYVDPSLCYLFLQSTFVFFSHSLGKFSLNCCCQHRHSNQKNENELCE